MTYIHITSLSLIAFLLIGCGDDDGALDGSTLVDAAADSPASDSSTSDDGATVDDGGSPADTGAQDGSTACEDGEIVCADGCIDPLTSLTHCGASADCTGEFQGVSCGGAQTCVGGACTCPEGLLLCEGTCINPSTDRAFCGAFADCGPGYQGENCGTDSACIEGACEVCDGAADLLVCEGTCVDPRTDATFCGAFADCGPGYQGTTCGEGSTCVAGSCTE